MKRGGCKFGNSKIRGCPLSKKGAVVSQLVPKLKESVGRWMDLWVGGHSDSEWLSAAKWPRGAEVVNTKILGQSTLLKAKEKGGLGGQIQTKNLIRIVTCKMHLFHSAFFFFFFFIKYMISITLKCFLEEL